MHSTASDGTDAPEALAVIAKRAGLAAIALTDHDTTAGLEACAAACKNAGVAFVPGIEVSADPSAVLTSAPQPETEPIRYGTLHILGYFVRHDDPGLEQIQREMTEAREQRNPAIVDKLRKLGMRIEYEEVLEVAREQGASVIGRPHIAQVLIQKGYVKSVQDAFARYIGQGAAAYVRRDRLDPRRAIDAIHGAGGLAVLAHPVQLKCPDLDHLEHFCTKLRDMGLDGMETRHSDHTAAQVARFEQIAQKLGLLTTGGSDYHGSRKSVSMGGQQVPMSVYEALASRVGQPGAAAASVKSRPA